MNLVTLRIRNQVQHPIGNEVVPGRIVVDWRQIELHRVLSAAIFLHDSVGPEDAETRSVWRALVVPAHPGRPGPGHVVETVVQTPTEHIQAVYAPRRHGRT